MIVILSYFHTRIGTDIYYKFPETPVEKEVSDRIYDVMTQQKEEEFFTHTFRNLKLLNYYFQISSDWARGNREMIMLSIILNQLISPEIEEAIKILCIKFAQRMRLNSEIYTGFYIKDLSKYDDKDKERIVQSELLVRQWVRDLYWETLEESRKKSEEEKITTMLNDRYIFESLEKMSEELKNISREIENSSSDNTLKSNKKIKNSILNLNKIIDDLYGGYIEKMTTVDIEDHEGIFSTDEDIDAYSLKSKKELLQLLEGEVKRKEE
ncbi:MAG: hypothetical protein ACFFC3_01990 [Candidatus Odinarchaeota archaeon]